jgi:hypothetical protein
MSGGVRAWLDEGEQESARFNTQPKPKANDSVHIADLVAVDLRYRKEFGLRKYGTPLQANNGRDALQDAYEEALDLCQYLKQAIEERKSR